MCQRLNVCSECDVSLQTKQGESRALWFCQYLVCCWQSCPWFVRSPVVVLCFCHFHIITESNQDLSVSQFINCRSLVKLYSEVLWNKTRVNNKCIRKKMQHLPLFILVQCAFTHMENHPTLGNSREISNHLEDCWESNNGVNGVMGYSTVPL